MGLTSNKTLIYKSHPDGYPVPGQDLVIEDRPLDIDAPPAGGMVVQVLYSSFDPYQRGRMRDPSVKSYFPPYTIGQPIENSAVVRVVSSDSEQYAKGDVIKVGLCPVAEYAAISGRVPQDPAVSYKIDEKAGFHVAHHLGALGMPGLTAYSSLYEIGKPKKGETIFISSAAGAVGQIVGQLAKRDGLTVIGSVGSDEKAEFITKELGFDAAFNYKTETPDAALTRLAPNGIDIYYENVGGDHLEAALKHINRLGRIPACGMIADYNKKPSEMTGVKGLMYIVGKELTIRGFIVSSLREAWAAKFAADVGKMLAEGSIKAKLHFTEGIDKAPEGLVGLFRGENFGKAVLKIAE